MRSTGSEEARTSFLRLLVAADRACFSAYYVGDNAMGSGICGRVLQIRFGWQSSKTSSVSRNDRFIECKSFRGLTVSSESQRRKVSLAVDVLVLHGARVLKRPRCSWAGFHNALRAVIVRFESATGHQRYGLFVSL